MYVFATLYAWFCGPVMDELKQLEAMGLVLPSPMYIVGAIVFGLVGMAAFYRGRKISNSRMKWTGVVLMLYPYAASETWLLWVLGVALCGWLYAIWN